MITRLGACGLILANILTIIFLVAFQSRSANFDNDWLLEDLTCDELVSGYKFELEMLNQVIESWTFCQSYADSPADSGHGELHCALLKKEGQFVQGWVNDIVGVYNIKCRQRE